MVAAKEDGQGSSKIRKNPKDTKLLYSTKQQLCLGITAVNNLAAKNVNELALKSVGQVGVSESKLTALYYNPMLYRSFRRPRISKIHSYAPPLTVLPRS